MSGEAPDARSATRADDRGDGNHREDSMALIRVTIVAGVLTAPQKREIVERLTDAMAAIEGENMRQSIWCIVDEVAGGEWGVGGETRTADDIKALARATPVGSPEEREAR
jgi:4-oxalocrotonate tautomerase